jgi:MoxR-vWA-beta-propeller ternary system domain bpX2
MKLLDDVCCASLPARALPVLGGLRTESGVRAWLQGDRVWLRWEPGRAEVLLYLLPIPGIELFARRDNLWYRPGQALPTFTVPAESESRPLAALVVPSRVEAEWPREQTLPPVSFHLERDDQPRPASALLCAPADLARWADLATTRELSALRTACCGARMLVLGAALPPLVDAARFWGQRVLTPLGWRWKPLLPEQGLAQALQMTADDIALVHHDGIEMVPWAALAPLTRAGLRLLLQGGRHGHG